MSHPASEPPAPDSTASRWPWSAMFWLGTFGCDTPSARRYHLRAYGALGLFVVLAVAAAIVQSRVKLPLVLWTIGIGMPVIFGYIMWSFHQYLSGLDELARRIQLEAVLLAFLFLIAGGILLSSISLFTGWVAHPVWVLLAEPVRGLGLMIAARRYR